MKAIPSLTNCMTLCISSCHMNWRMVKISCVKRLQLDLWYWSSTRPKSLTSIRMLGKKCHKSHNKTHQPLKSAKLIYSIAHCWHLLLLLHESQELIVGRDPTIATLFKLSTKKQTQYAQGTNIPAICRQHLLAAQTPVKRGRLRREKLQAK